MNKRLLSCFILLAVIPLLGCNHRTENKSVPQISKSCPEEMVYIPKGTFTMGCSDGDTECFEIEKPSKTTSVEAFCIDKYEFPNQKGVPPKTNVSWYEAKVFCNALGKRLPSETEWEFAARGGVSKKYYWGNKVNDSYAWYNLNSKKAIHPAGQKKPNSFGLHDISGNVWEWVETCYDLKCKYRLIRGGCANSTARYLRVSVKDKDGPGRKNNYLGFRCAKSLGL